MNFETGPFVAARAALISSGLFDGRLAFIGWEPRSGGIEPSHVIEYPFFEWVARFIAKCGPGATQVRLCEILIMGVRVVDVFGFEVRTERFVQNLHELVEGARLTETEVVDPALLRVHRGHRAGHDILHVNEIALLLAMFE